jgi:hypothetical protein
MRKNPNGYNPSRSPLSGLAGGLGVPVDMSAVAPRSDEDKVMERIGQIGAKDYIDGRGIDHDKSD